MTRYKWFMILIFLIITVRQVDAQEVGEIKLKANDSLRSLWAKNITTLQRMLLRVGQTVHYKLRSSALFEKGQIAWITDSLISFQGKKIGNVTVPLKDLAAFKIPRSELMKGAGYFLTVLGTGLVAGGVMLITDAPSVALNQDPEFPLGVLEAVTGLAFIGAGVVLVRNQVIDLEESWTLKATRAIVPGDVITVRMKNGEVIMTMEVTQVDPENILGVQRWVDSSGQWAKLRKIIAIKDVLECSRIIH